MRACARGDDIDDSHIRAGKVAPSDSHRRKMAVEQFRTPRSIQRRGSRDDGWIIDPDDEPIAEDIQGATEDVEGQDDRGNAG